MRILKDNNFDPLDVEFRAPKEIKVINSIEHKIIYLSSLLKCSAK